MFRKAEKEDRKPVVDLWQRVFGDAPEFIEACLDELIGPQNTFLAVDEEGAVQAMLHTVPCCEAGRKGVYLYALGTNPPKRATGIMTGLQVFAEQEAAVRGSSFACLIPANEHLYAYYRKRGYAETLSLRHLPWKAPERVCAERTLSASFSAPGGAVLNELRGRWLPKGWIGFDECRMQMLAGDLAKAGALLCQSEGGYAVCLPDSNKTPLVAELAAHSQVQAELLLEALTYRLNTQALALTLPPGTSLFAGQGELCAAALLKWLGPKGEGDGPQYFRFGFDEL